MAVADDVLNLLRQSIAEHVSAYVLRAKQLPLARLTLEKAYVLRKDAHLLDPDMTAEAWELERKRFYDSIDALLMAFYLRKLGP